MPRDDFEFPTCMHRLAAGMHMQGIDPQEVTITLPHPKWWALYSALERKMQGFMPFDGRGMRPMEFRYMGFRFVPATST
jgi:hypothetical protein